MQIVSFGDNLHEMSNPFFWENKKNNNKLSPAEFAKRMLTVKPYHTEMEINEYGSCKGPDQPVQSYIMIMAMAIH